MKEPGTDDLSRMQCESGGVSPERVEGAPSLQGKAPRSTDEKKSAGQAEEGSPLRELSMLELFRVETDTQAAQLTEGLLELERGSTTPEQLEALMRAAHSLKGAARIVKVVPAVRIAHAMEDCFVAAQSGQIELSRLAEQTDLLLRGVDLLVSVSRCDAWNSSAWETEKAVEVESFLSALERFVASRRPTAAGNAGCQDGGGQKPLSDGAQAPPANALIPPGRAVDPALGGEAKASVGMQRQPDLGDRVLRLAAENLNRLLGLAGESLVESRWLRPFSDSMQRLKRMQANMERTLEVLREAVAQEGFSESTRGRINEIFRQTAEARQFLADRLEELDWFDRRSAHLSNSLYLEVLRARMRPFADGVGHFPRMVRDLARSLGKKVKLEIIGESTQVDRDILERLEAPLNHLLRNAVDHGCEPSVERERTGKPPEATIRLEARHSAGMLMVVVSDDGAGVDAARVRRLIAEKQLTTPTLAEKMTESELLQFLFLPGFSLRDTVTEISGRGVGLDIVQNMVKSVRGSVRVSTQPGRGMRFQLQLPLTMSVLRALLVEVGGEPYAIPLAQIVSTLKLSRASIETLEGRHHFMLGREAVGLLAAHQVLDCQDVKPPEDDLPIVVLGDRTAEGFRGYGLLVDRFLGERELVVQPLDPRLGKVQAISAAALMEDGSPVLIVDVDDLMCSVAALLASGSPAKVGAAVLAPAARRRKRILAVDDSLTVRELERKLLNSHGYLADVAVDGMEGWEAVRSGIYDLVITDVDMPRMDGIELASLIKRDPQLQALPVMIVSYKDREEERLRGLEAGADYYLTKGSFHDETLLQAVQDLIGEPEE